MCKPRRRSQKPPWDLFHPRPQTPSWAELPRPTQRQLTQLLARLLRDRLGPQAPRAGDREAPHE